MSAEIRNLEPKALWGHFADLNEVPRPSKKEDRVIDFMMEFGKKLGLETIKDAIGNVVIRKPASQGMENRVPIVLQSHLDMVHQKNSDTQFDFENEGIKMFVEGDWVKAKGTTLGADNGIGVAAIMVLLASSDIPHPAIEALFTIDEETGMTGAKGLKGGILEGSMLLNLDTEEDDELTIGCAGGMDVTATGTYREENLPGGYKGFEIRITGLTGGHSGTDIHLGRGNSNKLMNRILYASANEYALRISSIDGGGLRNAIPRESMALVAVPEDKAEDFNSFINPVFGKIKTEYQTTDSEIAFTIKAITAPGKVMAQDFQDRLLRSIYACPNGIYRMSPDITDLVQSSNNLSRVDVKEGKYSIQCLTRSSVDSEKTDLGNMIKATFELLGSEVKFSGEYPGWAPRPESSIVKIMSNLYKELFNEKAHVNAVHAGLECGILGTNYPEMEMISFGPNIRGAHSPDERVQISSVQKFWNFLLETLKNIPSKN